MKFTITAEQRDALHDQIVDRMSGIGDFELAIRMENYDTAERIGREYADDLRLLLDDLRIGNGDGESVELQTPPEVLRRVLVRLHDLAARHAAGLVVELAEARRLEERNRFVIEASQHVLDQLEEIAE